MKNIGSMRLLNIKVILNDKETIYEGLVDDAPEEIKRMTYNRIELKGTVELFVNDSEN